MQRFPKNIQGIVRLSFPRGGFLEAILPAVSRQVRRRSGSGIRFRGFLSFQRVAAKVKVALTRRNFADAVTMYRSCWHGVTAKLNSAHPRPSYRPRASLAAGLAGEERSRQVRRDASEGNDIVVDSIARQLFPRFRLKVSRTVAVTKVATIKMERRILRTATHDIVPDREISLVTRSYP